MRLVMRPTHIDIKKDSAMTIQWSNGTSSRYPVAYLRRMSPSADARELREKLEQNPLTVLPGGGSSQDTIQITDAQRVGHYAIRLVFSDGHQTGLYSWKYLRQIDPNIDDCPGQTSE